MAIKLPEGRKIEMSKEMKQAVKEVVTYPQPKREYMQQGKDSETKLYMKFRGKDFVLYAGLLSLAHKNGLKSIETRMVYPEYINTEIFPKTVVFKATVTMKDDKIFEGHGDAKPDNVNKMILPHFIRMAETRAKARALRDALNIGTCSMEELGGDANGVGSSKEKEENGKS